MDTWVANAAGAEGVRRFLLRHFQALRNIRQGTPTGLLELPPHSTASLSPNGTALAVFFPALSITGLPAELPAALYTAAYGLTPGLTVLSLQLTCRGRPTVLHNLDICCATAEVERMQLCWTNSGLQLTAAYYWANSAAYQVFDYASGNTTWQLESKDDSLSLICTLSTDGRFLAYYSLEKLFRIDVRDLHAGNAAVFLSVPVVIESYDHGRHGWWRPRWAQLVVPHCAHGRGELLLIDAGSKSILHVPVLHSTDQRDNFNLTSQSWTPDGSYLLSLVQMRPGAGASSAGWHECFASLITDPTGKARLLLRHRCHGVLAPDSCRYEHLWS